jgi:TP901 family phage tail tape measure protein
MSRAGGIRAGRAFVELYIRDGEISKGLRKVQSQLKQFGSEVQRIGQGVLMGGAAGALPFGISAKAFADLEQRMAVVQAVTGATRSEFASLNAEAERLGKTTVFTASQAADAMGFFARAGFDVESILAATAPALDLAAAGQIEVADAANIATQVLKQFQLEAGESARIMDVLTRAATTANTTIPQLGDAFKYVGTLSNIAGASVEEVAALIQILSDAGIQGELAGTSIRGILATIANPSGEARKALEDLGVQFSDAEGNMLSLVDIFAQFEHSLEGLGKFAKLEILAKIFPNRQVAAVAGTIARGARDLSAFTETLRDAGGAAGEVAAVQLNTLKGSFTLAMSAANGLGITIGKELAPYLRLAFETATRVIRQFEAFAGQNRRLIIIAASASAALLGFGATLVVVGVSLKVTAFAVGALVSVIGLLKLAFTAVLFAIGAITSPITIMIGLMAGLGAAVVHYSGAGRRAISWLREEFGDLLKSVMPVLSGVQDALAAKDIPLAADIMFKGLEIAFRQGVHQLRGIWADFLSWMTRGMINAAAVSASVMELAKGGTHKLVNWVTDRAENAIFSIVEGWDFYGGDDAGERVGGWRENREAERKDRDNMLIDKVSSKLGEIERKRQKGLEDGSGTDRATDAIDEATEEMRRLEGELADLIAEAKKAREEEKEGRKRREAMDLDPASLLAQIGAGGAVGVRGTFGGSRAALSSLGSQSPLLKPVQDISKTTKSIDRKMDYGGSAFA